MPPVEVVCESVELGHLVELAQGLFGDLVKAVVDTELGIMALGGELHADEEATLLALGSRRSYLWARRVSSSSTR